MSKAADEYEDIARRLKELEADRQLALTGSTTPEPKVGEYAIGWPAGGSPSAYNDLYRGLMGFGNGESNFNPPDLQGRVKASG